MEKDLQKYADYKLVSPVWWEKEEEESANILAKWDFCLNPIKKKHILLCVDHRETNGLRWRRTVQLASMGRLVEV